MTSPILNVSELTTLCMASYKLSREFGHLNSLASYQQAPLSDSAMRDLFILFAHLLTTIAKILGPGGARAIVADSLLMKRKLNSYGILMLACYFEI